MAPNYNVIGTCKILEGTDGIEGYVSKPYVSGQKVLVLIPDAFGWNSGRLRNVADYFTEEGYYTVVPKIMTPCAEGNAATFLIIHYTLSSSYYQHFSLFWYGRGNGW